MRSLKLLLRRDWEKSRFGRHQPEGDDEADEDQVWRSHRYEMWINRLIRWSVLQDLVRVLPQNWFIHLRGHRLLSGFFTRTSSPSLSLSFFFSLNHSHSLFHYLSLFLSFSLAQSFSLSCPLLTQDLFLSLSSCFSVIAPMIRTDRFRFRKIGHSRKKHFEGISQSNSLAYCGSIKCTYKWINFLETFRCKFK